MKKFSSPKFMLLPDGEMSFEIKPDLFGNLCLIAGCHMDGESKVYTRIRLDQIPCTIRSRHDLIDFIDAYLHDEQSEGIFIPWDEQKFRLGFTEKDGQPVLYASVRVKKGFVSTDNVPLSELTKRQCSVQTFERIVINGDKRNA